MSSTLTRQHGLCACQLSASQASLPIEALGRRVGLGIGRAAGITPLRLRHVSKFSLGSARSAVAGGHQPNPTVNRTSTSGLRPLAAAGYLER